MMMTRKVGPVLSLLGIAGFVLASLWARWNPVQGQESPKTKTPEVKQPDAKGKTPAKQKAPANLKTNIPTQGQKLDHVALAKFIDEQITKTLANEKITASPKSDDAEFIRRVYLDLVGVIPPAEKVTAFLESKDADKRAKLIDELLNDPRFGSSLAETWANLMIPRESNNKRLNNTPLKTWLAEKFNKNVPLDKLVHDLLVATGTQDENGATTYFVANNSVDKITGNVSRMFLGVQLQCAQCHNHPFTDWKQTEYWGMAAFFMNTRISATPQQAAKKGTPISVTETPGGFKGGKKGGGLPEGAKMVPAKFLAAEEPKVTKSEPLRPVLADWMTSRNNPFFARAMVNRFWYQLLGRGIVNPVDDMHDDNNPTHPDLLAALAEQFKNNGHDLKYLMRAICNSDAYQRTSRPAGDNQSDKEYYSHRAVRALSPEQLYDSLVSVVGRPTGGEGRPGAFAGKKGPPITGRDGFINFFLIDEANPLEYQAGIPQAL